ncbi:MAG: CehA/McbA family metallohydrolase [Oscillibacter sp.]|nr:CehA/McbA family metallohydrolase [Oscillibacter sp.]
MHLSYTILSESNVKNITEARAGSAGTSSNPGDTFVVSGVVTYVSGSNFYIQDDTAGIVLFDNTLNLKRGQKVAVSGGLAAYNGLLELVKVSVLGTKTGTLPEAKEIAIADIDDSVQAQLVKITGAKVVSVSGKTVTLSANSKANNTINITNCPTIKDLSEGDTVTVTAVVSKNSSGNYLLVNSASDVVITDDVTPEEPDPDPGPVDPGEELYKPASGDKVALYYTGGNMVMTGEASGNRLKGENVTLSGGMLFTDKALVLTATVDNDGYYTFTTSDGKLLNTGNTGENLTLAPAADAVCTKWELTKTTKGDGWLIKSTGANYNGNYNQYIECYNSNFTVYGLKDNDDQGIFTMQFVKEDNIKVIDWTIDKEIEQTIAQWGGAMKVYDAPESVTFINGDKITVGDELDTNALYTVIKDGSPAMPLAVSKAPNYYMGGTDLIKGDYAQFKTSSKGWGGMELSFRLRVTNAGANSWQVQYSTDGTNFANFDKGSYSASYTSYPNGVATPVTKEGAVTGGVLKFEKELGGQYVSFKLTVPTGAENAEDLYIRLVSGNEKISGSSGDASGNIRVDTVKLTGSPVISDKITPYVAIEPDSTEEVGSGAAITLTAASGATVHYGWANNETGMVTYATGTTAIVPATLPATLFVYASSAGKADSVIRTMTYLPAAVAGVQMTPNGGSVYLGDGPIDVVLTTATEGATIYYSLGKVNSDTGSLEYEVYTPGTTKITLNPGFGSLTVSAYAVKAGFTDSAVTARTFTQRTSEKYRLYFGQMHSHTSYSDGAGTAEQAFSSVKALDQETWNMDFLSVTDHSNSFDDAGGGKRLSDVPTGQEWTEGKQLAKELSGENFVGLFGYEMTWSNGLGHINTFNTPGYQDRTQGNYTTYSTALQNYYEELKTVPTSISQFNHPGTTFGDFSDFAHYDEEIDRLITLIEVGNGEGAIGSSGYFPSYEYYTRALDKGWHVAPTNNQDNHKGGWGTANTGRDVVLVDQLSEEDIYDAMRNYRVYATEDLNLEIYYTFDGNIMGSILGSDSYGAGDQAQISVELKDPNLENASVEVIVNGGKCLASKPTNCNETVTFEIENPTDYSYYYIKITQDDGDIAVTAPVWVGAVEAVGITSLKAENAITITGKPQTFTLDLYNNERSNLEVTSIVFTDKATGQVLHTANDVTRVPKMGTASTTFSHAFAADGSVTVVATVRGTLKDVEKVYTQELELKVMPENVVSRILVDGSHYNDYVTGYYGGNMGNMTTIAAGLGVEVVIARQVTEELLQGSQLLVISAPARKGGTANAGNYTASAFEDEFIDMVKDYVESGGSVVVCGLADYQDKGAASAENHIAAQMNKLLTALGSTMRINDDEAYDTVHNGGQAYRLYPETFNMDSPWCRGIITPDSVAEGETHQTYSQYSGCTVNPGDGDWLVQGFDTTYAIDSDKDGLGGFAAGTQPAYFLACEDTAYGGTIFAAGGVFLSDFEVAAELDNIWDLPYANRTIYENILSMVRSGAEITPIAETRKAPLNKVFAIEGYVTSGTTNPNTTFFDSIYVQDETGGTDVFPYAAEGLAIGTKVRVLGYTDAYQGDRELQVISLEILNAPAKIYEPRVLTTAQATDYETYGGQLVKTSGKVSGIVMAGGRVSQFRLTDSSGRAATVFIDGYITNPQGVNNVHTWLKNGQTVSAVGLLYSHPEGDSDVSVPVLRVRNCDEIVNVSGGTSTPPSGSNDSGSSGGSSSHGSSSTRSVSVSSTKNGSVSFSPSNPAKGAKVTLTVRPNSGYVLDSIKVLDSKGVEVELTAKDNNQFTFTMPSGKVTVDAKFVSKDSAASAPSFSDVSSSHWASAEISWAAEKGIMQGVGDGVFAPERTVTRQQLWMVMARIDGSDPADMAAACAWAKNSSVSDGTRPGNSLTRQQMVAILYRYAQLKDCSVAGAADTSSFPDHANVSNYAKEAMAWAVGSGIVAGTSDGRLDPSSTATRAQFVVIMHRFCELYSMV